MRRILPGLLVLGLLLAGCGATGSDTLTVQTQRTADPFVITATAETTIAPTAEPTTLPTEALTEEATEPSTEAPTEESTEPSTEAPTEESTEPPTEAPEEEPVASSGQAYVLNKNSKKFHYPNCSSVSRMKEKNRKDFYGSREEVLDMGYVPCKNCHP